MRSSLGVCLSEAPPIDCGSFHGMQKKQPSNALSAVSETLGTNAKAEGSRSSPISPRCKESVPDSLDARIYPSFGCDTEATSAARATASTVTHGWQSSQIICSTSFFVQLLCCSLFPCIPANSFDVRYEMLQILQFDKDRGRCMLSECTIAQLSQRNDFR